MKTNIILSTILACSITGSVHAAPEAHWATAIANNKTSELLTTEIDSPQVNTSHQTVSFSYKLDKNEPLNFDTKPFVENSRQFWLDSTGLELSQGIDLPVTGGDTIIRISPLTNDNSIKLTADSIQLSSKVGANKIQVFADSDDLKAAGTSFSDNSIALKVKTQAGNLKLRVDTVRDKTPFVIHVLEKDSPYVLSLSANKATYGVNQQISVNTEMLVTDFATGKNINSSIQGYINRPDGSKLGDLNFTIEENGSYTANIGAVGPQGLAQGLWEVHVFAESMENGIKIMRDAQTSFAVNLNTAEFSNNLKITADNIEVGVNVGLEGSYEVRGVLMGTNKYGELQAIAMTMTAAWLVAGQQSINLKLDTKLMAESGLSAPYIVKNMQLTNQTYLAPVQTIQTGIVLTGFDLGFDIELDIR